MTYVLLDDAMADHPKVIGLSDAAFRLFIVGICYCSTHLTDGFISDKAFLRCTAGVPRTSRARSKNALIDGTLWERVEGGYMVTNYLDWNPSKEKVERLRQAKKLAGKKGAEVRWNGDELDTFERGTFVAPANAPIPIPSTTDVHTPSVERDVDALEIKAKDIDPNVRAEMERLVRTIPDGRRSIGRLVKAARAGAPQFAFADARAAYQAADVQPFNAGAWVCNIVEKNAGLR